jgi:hypothetical protein
MQTLGERHRLLGLFSKFIGLRKQVNSAPLDASSGVVFHEGVMRPRNITNNCSTPVFAQYLFKHFLPLGALHAATCLQTGAALITNDKHFDRIKKEGVIEVWNASMAIKELL